MTTIGITPGQGIGPEVLSIALAKASLPNGTRIIICGKKNDLNLDRHPQSIQFTESPSPQSALLEVIDLAKMGVISSIVTGPVRKSILQDIDGRSYPGQTELFEHYLSIDQKPALMSFIGGPFILGLATAHLPIRQVADQITPELIRFKLDRLIEHTKGPICVLGLNPHAGEEGLLGLEEKEIIEPVIQEYQSRGLCVEGPLAADGFFAYRKLMPAAVLAMTHDQGLAPYKLLCRGKVANQTLGLSVPRLSPAHGTADDLVRTGLVDPTSMITALEASVSDFNRHN